jgi:hypothetical protein
VRQSASSVTTKQRQREQIERDTLAYLQRGGTITRLPIYATSVVVEVSKRMRKALGQRVVWGDGDAE